MSLLKRLKLGQKNEKIVKFPDTEQDIIVRVLSDQEKQQAAVAAYHYLKRNNIEYDVIGTADIYEDELVSQCLWRALYDPENPMEKLCATIVEFKKLITLDEKAKLARIYQDFEEDCSPDVSKMDKDEFDKLVEDIKKNAGKTLLKYSDIRLLKKVITTLVSRQYNSQEDN